MAQIQIQLIDDAAYAANLAQGRDGFDGEVTTYTLWVEGVSASAADAQMRTASSDTGDWYPSFAPDQYSYNIVVPNGTASGTLTYTVAEGAEVRVGSAEQTPDGEGVYTLNLKTSAQTITVTSADGSISNSYSVKLLAKSSDPGRMQWWTTCASTASTPTPVTGSSLRSPWSAAPAMRRAWATSAAISRTILRMR